MKKLLSIALLSICVFSACKKSNSEPGVVVDYYNAYDATYGNLRGVWTVAGTPQNTNAPYSSSVMFDQTAVSFMGFDGSVVTTLYNLSLDNNVFYINIKTSDVVKKCQIVKLTQDTLQLQSVIGATNQVTVNEVFVRKK